MDKQSFHSTRFSQDTHVYTKRYVLDEKDKKILLELCNDGRMSLADLSKKVGLSRDAIKNRIIQLMKNQCIVNFKPLLNLPALGYPILNYVIFTLHAPDPKEEERFCTFLKNHPRVTYIASLIGNGDYIIDVVSENQGEFSSILKDIRNKFPNLINDYKTFGVLEEKKYEQYEGLFNH